MLKIKNKYHLDFPFIIEGFIPRRELEFVPVPDDDDELTQAIEQDSAVHDNRWVLTEHPDPEELDAFWTKVEQEVTADPDWTFENDS